MPNKRHEQRFLFVLGAISIKGTKRRSRGPQNLQFVEFLKITTLQMQICACNTLLSKEIDLCVNDNA